MKKCCLIFAICASLLGCTQADENPYSSTLCAVNIQANWPEGYKEYTREGAVVSIQNISFGNSYKVRTDSLGGASASLPQGLYRFTMSDINGENIFNATLDKVAVNKAESNLSLNLSRSKAGKIVIKEIYCGGCMKTPQQGTYQFDKYIILHNNSYQTEYLDSICFGSLAPYNSNSNNRFVKYVDGNAVFPDYMPIAQAIWQFGGDGDDFPLQPGEDAVLCLNGAIDHSKQYPLSVNLNVKGYFVAYDNVVFTNTTYHPAPGDQIDTDHYLRVVNKFGIANAYTYSVNSPATVLFKAPAGTTIQDYLKMEGVLFTPEGATDGKIAKIPFDWVMDAVEVFNGSASSNTKRLEPTLDAGFVYLSSSYLGHSLHRYTNEDLTSSLGYEVLTDTNNSTNDFYERETQSLHD